MAKVCRNESGRCQKMISIVNECVYKRTGLCFGHRQPRPTTFTLWLVCSRRLRLLVLRHFLWCVFFSFIVFLMCFVEELLDVPLCMNTRKLTNNHSLHIWYRQPLSFKMHIRRATSIKKIQEMNQEEWKHERPFGFPCWYWWWFLCHGEGHLSFCFSFHPFIQFRYPIPSLPKLHAHVLYMHLLYPSPMFSNAVMHCNEHFAGPKSTCRKLNDGHQQNKSRKKGRNVKRRFRGGLKYGPRVLWFLILLFPIPFGLLHVLLPCPLFLMLALLAILGIIHRPRMFSRFNRRTYSSITLVFLWRGRRRAVRFFLGNDVTTSKATTKKCKAC